jgi:hypothetical protein
MKKLKVIPQTTAADATKPFPTPAVSSIPKWFKDMRHTLPGHDKVSLAASGQGSLATMKWCQPVLDSFSSGYVFTLSADVEVSLNDSGYPDFKWRGDETLVNGHPIVQTQGFPVSTDYYNQAYKFLNNVVIETPPGYSLLFTHPLNRLDLPFQTMSGVVDTDAHPIAVNFPFYLKRNFEGIIEQGTPIVQLIPIKRENWSREESTFSRKDTLFRDHKFSQTIYRSYKKNFWTRKSYG